MTSARDDLTFEQREGMRPLPTQLKLKEVDAATRALVWNCVYSSMKVSAEARFGYLYLGAPWSSIMRNWHIRHEFLMADEYSPRHVKQEAVAKSIISQSPYARFFGFIEFICKDLLTKDSLIRSIDTALVEARSAYRIIDRTVMPLSSEEDAETVRRALDTSSGQTFAGARTHILSAGSLATSGDWAASVRESIHAVESAARVLVPGSKTLAPALAELEKRSRLHGGMKNGFSALYGFTSDEKGIRHALLDGSAADVDEADALYMLGACSAFVSFLATRDASTT